jgi:hypothetical protein
MRVVPILAIAVCASSAHAQKIDLPTPDVKDECAHVELDGRYDGFPRNDAIRLCMASENQYLNELPRILPHVPRQRIYRCSLMIKAYVGSPSYYETLAGCLSYG